jgi:threonine dehydrogenase-like Zn-dependent dehydrogenase
LPNGPRTVIATDVNEARLDALRARFAPLAEQHNRHLLVLNADAAPQSLRGVIMQESQDKGADDIVVCVPSAEIMAEAGRLLNPEGMLILFAGVPNGTLAPLDLSTVYLGNAQYTGTSGLTIHDQAQVMHSAERKALSPGRSVAAIGGMRAARDGIEALMNGRFAGKIVIFPQIMDLPLVGLDELHALLPRVAAKLGPDNTWTNEAEAELIESGWQQPGKPA